METNKPKITLSNYPEKWDICGVAQKKSRDATTPPIPADPVRSHRFFVIISPSLYNQNGDFYTCLPITSEIFHQAFDVLIKRDTDNDLTHDSHVNCSRITTIEGKYLTVKWGKITDSKVKEAIRDRLQVFLELDN